MKQHTGNYLGLCINNDDPQKRGRVQVFVPHILPNLLEGWNDAGKDIEILGVGDNIQQNLSPEILEKLKKILPWCEAASPVAGTSAPGNLAGNYYDQSPVSERSDTDNLGGSRESTSTSPQISRVAGLDTSVPMTGPVRQSVADPRVGSSGSGSPGTLPNTGLPQQGGMVLNTDKLGPTPMLNMNNMAAGMYSYPAAGSLLWVFFREGNPIYPVYFAANYGEKEWQSAYRYDSQKTPQDGEGYKPNSTEENPTTSVGGTWKMGEVAAMQWLNRTDPKDPLNNEKTFMLGDHSGSNIAMTKNGMFITSTTNRRDQVQLDRSEITLGNKEIFVQGEYSENYIGNKVTRVGNTSPEAVAAAQEIADYISQIMAPLAVPKVRGKSSGGGPRLSSGGRSYPDKPALANRVPGSLGTVGENVLKNWGAPPDFASLYGVIDGRIVPVEPEDPFVNTLKLRTLGQPNFFYKTTGAPSRKPQLKEINVVQSPVQSFQTFLKPTKLNPVTPATSGKIFSTFRPS